MKIYNQALNLDDLIFISALLLLILSHFCFKTVFLFYYNYFTKTTARGKLFFIECCPRLKKASDA